MAALSHERMAELLKPYLEGAAVPEPLYGQFSTYLELLLKWNARTNLTAIREPEEIVRRHFGEGLFTARHLEPLVAKDATLLDFGSGAGFPGLPIQLFLPQLRVTLAESQGKKASFLREAVRTLGLKTEVFAGRVEAMPAERVFDAVTLRAVDGMAAARVAGAARVAEGGFLVTLEGADGSDGAGSVPLPGTDWNRLRIMRISR